MNETVTVHQKITNIRSELREEFIERDEQVDGALCALLSRQHMLMVGAPGTAKSMMTDRICSKIEGAQYFTWLLTKFSTPEEIFGPVSLKGLENDEYKRITTHKLPEAHIGFLDEVFKANSAILNALLTLINERKYHNNGAPVKVPLQSLFGASNELPEGEELGALYDRFMFRYIVNYIAEDSDMKKMLKMEPNRTTEEIAADMDKIIKSLSENPNDKQAQERLQRNKEEMHKPISTIITLAELEQAQKEAAAIPVPDEILDTLIKIRNELKKEGVIASDRRFRFSIDILRAFAWLNGRKTVGEDDVVVLQHVLWSQPAELKTVQRVVLSTANPLLNKLTELFDQAQEIFKNCMDAVKKDANQASGAGVEANAKLKVIAQKFVELENTAKQQGRDTRNIQEHAAKVSKMNAEVLEKCLGLKFT